MRPLEPCKVQSAEDVTEQDQLSEVDLLQQCGGFLGTADIGAEVDVRKDQGVTCLDHASAGCAPTRCSMMSIA